jgi:hypothetical protein
MTSSKYSKVKNVVWPQRFWPTRPVSRPESPRGAPSLTDADFRSRVIMKIARIAEPSNAAILEEPLPQPERFEVLKVRS